jgi:hypothetical protein
VCEAQIFAGWQDSGGYHRRGMAATKSTTRRKRRKRRILGIVSLGKIRRKPRRFLWIVVQRAAFSHPQGAGERAASGVPSGAAKQKPSGPAAL